MRFFFRACMHARKKKRMIVSLLFFSLPWFLSPLRGDGKQSWYPFFFCFYVVKTTTSMVIQRLTIMRFFFRACMQARKKKRMIVSLLFFSLPWFLSPLRGDGKQSWYPKRRKRRLVKIFDFKRRDKRSMLSKGY